MFPDFLNRRFPNKCTTVSYRNSIQINLIGKSYCETAAMFKNHVSYLE